MKSKTLNNKTRFDFLFLPVCGLQLANEATTMFSSGKRSAIWGDRLMLGCENADEDSLHLK